MHERILEPHETIRPVHASVVFFPRYLHHHASSIFSVQVWDPEGVVIIPDHYIFTADPRANRNVDILRDFVNEQASAPWNMVGEGSGPLRLGNPDFPPWCPRWRPAFTVQYASLITARTTLGNRSLCRTPAVSFMRYLVP